MTDTCIEREANFALERLTRPYLERTIDCVVRIWVEDNVIARALGVTREEYHPVAARTVREALADDLALILVDQVSDEVVGFHFSRDLVDELADRNRAPGGPAEDSPRIRLWGEMLASLERRYVHMYHEARGQPLVRGEVLYFSIGGIVPALRRRGWIIRMGTTMAREMGVRRGFRRILGIATHPRSVAMLERGPFQPIGEFEFATADDPRLRSITEPRAAIMAILELGNASTVDRAPAAPASSTLDPDDWDGFRQLCHELLDRGIDRLRDIHHQPVWTPVPDDVKSALRQPVPTESRDPREVCEDIDRLVMPYPTGNIHPRFFGWVHGSGTAGGLLPAIVSTVMNSNVGGRDHGAVYVERQVIEWFCQLFGLPDGAGGILVSGTSMATLIGLAVARHRADPALRRRGVPPVGRLVGYTSSESHRSVTKAFELLGLGSEALRSVPVDSEYRMDVAALRQAVAEDRAAGMRPFCVIATAGTVNTGSIDDLDAIATVAAAEDLWLHVDGAFGGLLVLHEPLKPRLRGIERADSIAFDFHKWMHVRYDAGCVLVRDHELHRAAFTSEQSYLAKTSAGLAGGAPWFCDYGPELSRGFRALDVWYALQRHGTRRLGEAIAENCALANHLARVVDAQPYLQRMAPVSLAIVCFRYLSPTSADLDLDRLNGDIVVALHERGIAAPSTTRIAGQLAIRVNITNHRTRRHDLDELVSAVLAIGGELATQARPG